MYVYLPQLHLYRRPFSPQARLSFLPCFSSCFSLWQSPWSWLFPRPSVSWAASRRRPSAEPARTWRWHCRSSHRSTQLLTSLTWAERWILLYEICCVRVQNNDLDRYYFIYSLAYSLNEFLPSIDFRDQTRYTSTLHYLYHYHVKKIGSQWLLSLN